MQDNASSKADDFIDPTSPTDLLLTPQYQMPQVTVEPCETEFFYEKYKQVNFVFFSTEIF